MDDKQLHKAKESIEALQTFINQSTSTKKRELEIEKMVDQKVNQKLSNFLKTMADQLTQFANSLDIIDHEETNNYEEVNEVKVKPKPKDKSKQLTDPNAIKNHENNVVIEILKENKTPMRLAQISKIAKEKYNVKWNNGSIVLNRVIKDYPVERIGFGEYQYIEENEEQII